MVQRVSRRARETEFQKPDAENRGGTTGGHPPISTSARPVADPSGTLGGNGGGGDLPLGGTADRLSFGAINASANVCIGRQLADSSMSASRASV